MEFWLIQQEDSPRTNGSSNDEKSQNQTLFLAAHTVNIKIAPGIQILYLDSNQPKLICLNSHKLSVSQHPREYRFEITLY